MFLWQNHLLTRRACPQIGLGKCTTAWPCFWWRTDQTHTALHLTAQMVRGSLVGDAACVTLPRPALVGQPCRTSSTPVLPGWMPCLAAASSPPCRPPSGGHDASDPPPGIPLHPRPHAEYICTFIVLRDKPFNPVRIHQNLPSFSIFFCQFKPAVHFAFSLSGHRLCSVRLMGSAASQRCHLFVWPSSLPAER